MALSRISGTSGLLTPLSRISHAAAHASLGDVQCTRYTAVHHNRAKGLHVTSVRRYPDPPPLPLPMNVSEIFANETGRFTPERARDIAAPVLLYGQQNGCKSVFVDRSSKSTDRSSIPATCSDTHVDSYDCFGAVSLNGTMQSNVPKPFCSSGKSTHLNMPGGQWARDGKYLAEDMQKSHYRVVRLPKQFDMGGPTTLLRIAHWQNYIVSVGYATQTAKIAQKTDGKENAQDPSKKERFKILVRDYGSTVFVFHIIISLISLGACYTAFASGVDFSPIIKKLIKEEAQSDILTALTTSSTFLAAYTVHKCFAPIRLSITLGLAPVLVRYLRRIGILKRPKIKAAELK